MNQSRVQIGYTLSSEELPPLELINNAQVAERAGFDFVSVSDHFHPWIDNQGQSPFVWTVLGGISQVTDNVKVLVGVNCPIMRYHPAIVAQAGATVGMLLENRFWLGVGTGEYLNEHIMALGWPHIDTRLEMLSEAVLLIRELWKGGYLSFEGEFFSVEMARIYSLPNMLPPIIMASSGEKSTRLAGKLSDGFVSTSVDAESIKLYENEGGKGKPKFTQISVCYSESEQEAKKIVYKYWPISGLQGPLNTELRLPSYFEQAVKMLDEDSASEGVILGPDPEKYLNEVQRCIDAGFDHIYFHQIGQNQKDFLNFFKSELLPELK